MTEGVDCSTSFKKRTEQANQAKMNNEVQEEHLELLQDQLETSLLQLLKRASDQREPEFESERKRETRSRVGSALDLKTWREAYKSPRHKGASIRRSFAFSNLVLEVPEIPLSTNFTEPNPGLIEAILVPMCLLFLARTFTTP